MKIIDEQNLIPDKRILIQIISNHPFVSDLSNKLETVQIEISENHGIPKEMIQFDPSNTHVILGIGKGSHQKENFEYILYHEFGHAADRLNPGFEYSEKEKSLLSAKEKMGVMELWNTYIDSRLNESGLFKLGYQPPSTGKLNGKVVRFPEGLNGELLSHISILENCGLKHEKANKLVDDIWNNPRRVMTYKDMILSAKSGT